MVGFHRFECADEESFAILNQDERDACLPKTILFITCQENGFVIIVNGKIGIRADIVAVSQFGNKDAVNHPLSLRRERLPAFEADFPSAAEFSFGCKELP